MRNRFLLAAAAAALIGGTLAGVSPAAAQAGARIQSRGYNESAGDPCGFNSAVGCYGYRYGYRGYRGYRSYAFAPPLFWGSRYRHYRYRHWW
jgi:hypothetical protein